MRTIRWSRRKQGHFIDLREPDSYRAAQVCARCGGAGAMVWADLVTHRARHRCTRCRYEWIDAGHAASVSAPEERLRA